MRYRKLGSSDLQVSEISLGSWLTYSGGVAFEQTRACTEAAFDAGINFYDTEEVERPWPELAMPHNEAVLADRALQRWDARDEQHDDHHRVGGKQSGHPADRGGDAAGRAERAGALGCDRERDRDAEPEAGQRGEDADDERTPARGLAAAGRGAQHAADTDMRVGAHAVAAGKPGVVQTVSSSRIVMAS
jgi:hypothetical protein